MSNDEAKKMLEEIEKEITPEKYGSTDEYLEDYGRRFYELFGAECEDDPESIKEAYEFFRLNTMCTESKGHDNVLDFEERKNKKQLADYFGAEHISKKSRKVNSEPKDMIAMDYDQIAASLKLSMQ